MQTETQIRAAVRVRFLAPTDHAGSRLSAQDDTPPGCETRRAVYDYPHDSSTPEADAAQAWLDRFLNGDPERRSRAVLHPVATRWGRDTFFTWNWEEKE